MTVKVAHIKIFLISIGAGLTLSYQACSRPDGFSAYRASAGSSEFASGGSGGTTTDNPKPTNTLQVAPFNAVGSKVQPQISLCVTEIRFEQNNDKYVIETAAHSVALDPAGTLISSNLDVPAGLYDRIEMRLSDECNRISASVINSFGRFRISREVDLRFSGQVTVDGSGRRVVLDMQSIIEKLNQATSNETVENILENEEGGCSG